MSAPRHTSDELAKMVYQVAAITRELFPGKLVVETDVDPECKDDVCLLVQVEATGDSPLAGVGRLSWNATNRAMAKKGQVNHIQSERQVGGG